MKIMSEEIVSLHGSQSGKIKLVQSKTSKDVYSMMSVRSKDSSASSENKAIVIRSFCRSLLEFLFTQVCKLCA
jgi:hypothetical protein